MPRPGPVAVRRRLLRALQIAVTSCGGDRLWVRCTEAHGAVILMYHSVVDATTAPWIDPRFAVPQRTFAQQMRFLASRRRVVSLGDVVEALARNDSPPAGSVVITFDDGHLNNCTVAAPILAALGLPATFFLATGYVGRGEPQPTDRLYSLFRARTRSRLDLEHLGSRVFDLQLGRDVDEAHALLDLALLRSTPERRSEVFDHLAAQLRPASSPPRLTMTWDDARRLRQMSPGFEIGAHTREHITLTERSAETVDRELVGCVDDIERALGHRPRLFAYPYGRYDASVRASVAERFRAAVATDPHRPARRGDDLHALPRVTAPTHFGLFRFYTSGAYPEFSRWLTGQA